MRGVILQRLCEKPASRACAIARFLDSAAGLTKVKISALAGLSAATGHILAIDGVSAATLVPAMGVFLVSAGAGALNQVQERKIDSLMHRTRHRPIPARRIGARGATAVALALMATGTLVLYHMAAAPAAALAALAVLWYNGVYTYLKRVSRFAAIPGGLVGVIPPAVGWTAAGAALTHPEILSLMVFMFVWQVPHFWLLLLRHRDDYLRAGLPSATDTFTASQLGRIAFIWILAAAVSCLIVPLAGKGMPILLSTLLAATTLFLVISAVRLLGGARGGAELRPGSIALFSRTVSSVYLTLNIYALLVLSLLSAGGILDGRS